MRASAPPPSVVQVTFPETDCVQFQTENPEATYVELAAELVGRYLKERPGLPAIALTTDTSILTSVGNDYGFDQLFELRRGVVRRDVAGLVTEQHPTCLQRNARSPQATTPGVFEVVHA